MRTNLLSPLAAAFLAAVAIGQSPLSMPFNANNGLSAGAQIFFDLDVTTASGVTLTALDVNTGATTIGTLGSVEVWTTPTTFLGVETNPAVWTLAASGPVTASGDNLPSHACLGAGVFLAQGTYGVAVRHIGVALRYTGTSGTTFPPISTGSTAELSLQAGKGQATPFSSAPINFRVFNGNLYYNVGNVPGGPCANKVTYGTGCYALSTSWYELFAQLQNFDLAGTPGTETVIGAFQTGGAWTVQAGTPAWFTPVAPKVLTNAATPAQMGDDSMSGPLTLPFPFTFPGGSTTVIHANSNGFIVLGATTATTGDFTPTAAELLSQPARLAPLWTDLQPATNIPTNAASGVYFDVDPSNQTVYVTWLDVADRRGQIPAAGATSVTFQVAISANGNIEYRFRGVTPAATGAGAVITGASKGNNGGSNSFDPGSRDLTTSLPFTTDAADQAPLALDSNLPLLGTNWVLTTTNVEAISPIGATFFGTQQVNPGLDLTFIGAPSCFAYTNADVGSLTFLVASGSGSVTVPVPNDPSLGGVSLSAQSVSFTTQNALTLNFSNGLFGTIGQ
jgi:hypothetical protein